MKRLLSAILLSQILFIGCYDNHKEPESFGQQQIGTTTIANVYAMCNGSNVLPIKADISIRGVVVSSDSQSFINKAIYIDDGTATAKVCINMSQSSNDTFPTAMHGTTQRFGGNYSRLSAPYCSKR